MHVNQDFFVEDVISARSQKVVLREEPKEQRLEFTRKTNLEISMFDLGNNANHANLRMIIPLDQVLAPLENVDF
jgi:hypothetical protein